MRASIYVCINGGKVWDEKKSYFKLSYFIHDVTNGYIIMEYQWKNYNFDDQIKDNLEFFRVQISVSSVKLAQKHNWIGI